MRRHLLLVAVVGALAALLAACVPLKSAPPPPTYQQVVEGRVFDYSGSGPLEGIVVAVNDTRAAAAGQDVTDANGYFSLVVTLYPGAGDTDWSFYDPTGVYYTEQPQFQVVQNEVGHTIVNVWLLLRGIGGGPPPTGEPNL